MKRVREAHSVKELKAMGSYNIVARDLWPAAFAPYDEWSGAIADARCKARRSAHDLRAKNPAEFAQIVKDTLRRAELVRLSDKTAV